jgi:hypothetical protein
MLIVDIDISFHNMKGCKGVGVKATKLNTEPCIENGETSIVNECYTSKNLNSFTSIMSMATPLPNVAQVERFFICNR